jgi:hypothetical protein
MRTIVNPVIVTALPVPGIPKRMPPVRASHRGPRTDKVSLGYLFVDCDLEIRETGAKHGHDLFDPLRPRRCSRGRIAVDIGWRQDLVQRRQPALVKHLPNESPVDSFVSIVDHQITATLTIRSRLPVVVSFSDISVSRIECWSKTAR